VSVEFKNRDGGCLGLRQEGGSPGDRDLPGTPAYTEKESLPWVNTMQSSRSTTRTQRPRRRFTSLNRAAFNIAKLSIVGKDYHTEEHVVGYYNVGDRMKYWGKLGALWGSVWGWLLGAGFFSIPGIGPVLVAGPLVGWILGALEGAVITGGVTAIGAGLISLGIPKDSVLKYETELKSDKYILVVQGTEEEAAHARRLLQTTRPHSIETHTTAA